MSTFEEAKQIISTDSLKKIQRYFPEINFDEELKKNPELAEYIRHACVSHAVSVDDPRRRPGAPKLNEDFSKYFIIHNLPKCDQAKSQKLKTLLVKLLSKKNVNIKEGDIEMPFNGEITEGVAFLEMSSEEQAKLAAAIINNYQLDKNHLLSAAQINDFERIMKVQEVFEIPKSASLIDLRSHVLDTKREQYVIQSGKEAHLKYHQGQGVDHRNIELSLQDNSNNASGAMILADKNVSWSPKGTFLIVIKHDKVDFLGGENMQPIITIPESKVEYVSMSPCERYVLTYAPMAKSPFVIWNFQLIEIIRDFDQKEGENLYSYQWSFDGNYIAKKFKTETTQKTEDGKEEVVKVKQGVSVYTLPSMELLLNEEGQKKSITIDGIADFKWCPTANFFAFTAFPTDNAFPRIGFIEVPSRRQIALRTIAKAKDFKLYFHPQGDFLAVMNQYKEKKTMKYTIELFNTKNSALPHQQIVINREVLQFQNIYWEPYHSKIAIHTLSKRQVEAGKKEYTLDAQRNGVDIYELTDDPLKGFNVKTLGFLNSERVTNFAWSGAGDCFNVFENEGGKTSISFYMISEEKVVNTATTAITATQKVQKKENIIASKEIKYDFKKTARHDVTESKYDFQWDFTGRCLALYGLKRGPLDKSDKTLKFYNVFGDLLGCYEKIPQMNTFQWRPRQRDILKPNQIQKLKVDYKTKYLKKFKEEEKKERQEMNKFVNSTKKVIRDEFLNDFFLPLRKEFEGQINQYEKLWPLKSEDYVEEPVNFEIIYSYDNVISERKIQ